MSNGRIGIDISTVKTPRKSRIIVSKPKWLMVVDERSGVKLSSFRKNKDDIVTYLAEKFSTFKNAGIHVLKVRYDNVGENKSAEKEANNRKWRLNIEFECISKNMHQQNVFTEVAIATMTNRGKDMRTRSGIPEKCRIPPFKYAVTTATKLDILLIVEVEGRRAIRCLHYAGTVSKFVKYLRTWGEASSITIKTDNTSKPRDCEVHCVCRIR